jgi:hypothetical protein
MADKKWGRAHDPAEQHCAQGGQGSTRHSFGTNIYLNLKLARVHDLRHTFGQRLRAVGVPLEDRKALLGHKCHDITTHYSAPELAKLIEYVERVCEERPNTVLRLASPASPASPAKVPHAADYS